VNESVALSELGSSADACWREIPEHHEGVGLDEYVVMPNHVHGIVIINEKSRGDVHGRDVPGRDVQLNVPTGDTLNVPTDDTSRLNVPTDDTLPLNVPTDQNQPRIHRIGNSISPVKGSLSVIIRTFKAAVTTWARANGHPDFTWQGRFHDHIIRDEDDLYRIRTYIRNNPLKWALDQENPDNVGSAQGSS
jgi:REP element-mobilizing transposase RayT